MSDNIPEQFCSNCGNKFLDILGFSLCPECNAKLSAHKTRKPVINEIQNIPNQQVWVFEVLAYCNSIGISPDQLIADHKRMMEYLKTLIKKG